MDKEIIAAMELALKTAQNSPDRSTQNGAVIIHPHTGTVVAAGCNTYPKGLNVTEEHHARPAKYSYIEHAERNAIYSAAFYGGMLDGKIMVCPWAACADCARAIVQSGIKKLIRFPLVLDDTNLRWVESCEIGDNIMKEGGVAIVEYDFPEVEIPRLLRDEKIWTPKRRKAASV